MSRSSATISSHQSSPAPIKFVVGLVVGRLVCRFAGRRPLSASPRSGTRNMERSAKSRTAEVGKNAPKSQWEGGRKSGAGCGSPAALGTAILGSATASSARCTDARPNPSVVIPNSARLNSRPHPSSLRRNPCTLSDDPPLPTSGRFPGHPIAQHRAHCRLAFPASRPHQSGTPSGVMCMRCAAVSHCRTIARAH